jgi:putative addiction module component (TIGR02574 family)
VGAFNICGLGIKQLPSTKHASISRKLSPERVNAMMENAPESVNDPDCPYDPNDPKAVAAFWQNGVVVKGGGVATNPQERFMPDRVAELAAQIQSLPPEERVRLLDLLLESLEDPVDRTIENAWALEIERRVLAHQRGEGELFDVEDVMTEAAHRVQ